MVFRYAILYVRDVRDSVDFYARAFGLEPGFVHPSGDYGEMATGETRLAFSSISLMKSIGKAVAETAPPLPSFEFAFETADVAGALKKALDAGAELIQDMMRMDWGQTTAYVKTPEGTVVELCTKVDATA